MASLLDGSSAGELISELARHGLQQLIELEVAAFLGAERHERTNERLGYRNGYRPSRIHSSPGASARLSLSEVAEEVAEVTRMTVVKTRPADVSCWKQHFEQARRVDRPPSHSAAHPYAHCLPLKASVGPSRYAADSRIKRSLSPRATGCKAKDA